MRACPKTGAVRLSNVSPKRLQRCRCTACAKRRYTQKQLAEAMQLDQSRISKIERRADVYVSTLRNFVQAMGGELELVAKFPDGRVKITSLGEKQDLVASIEEP